MESSNVFGEFFEKKFNHCDFVIDIEIEIEIGIYIDKPEWFEAHYKQEKANRKRMHNHVQGTNFNNLSYNKRGLKYALATKAVFGKNLMSKIQKEGAICALEFCNMKVFPLPDSMAVVHKATIKRVSDKPRNPKNMANTKENEYIAIFKTDVKANK